jgi:sec-independent protein translocase protein TatB
MIDLAWSEIALIAVVALVVIGPKDLPEAVRGVARGVQKLRRMAGEFRSQADELVREANLEELRQQIHDIRNFNVRDEVEKTVDKDGSFRRSFDDPLRDTYTPPPPPAATEGADAAHPATATAAPDAAAPAAHAPPPGDAAAPSEPQAGAAPHPVSATDAVSPRPEAAVVEAGPAAAAPPPAVHRT